MCGYVEGVVRSNGDQPWPPPKKEYAQLCSVMDALAYEVQNLVDVGDLMQANEDRIQFDKGVDEVRHKLPASGKGKARLTFRDRRDRIGRLAISPAGPLVDPHAPFARVKKRDADLATARHADSFSSPVSPAQHEGNV
eukprot:7055602-Pyramimonas_sp.AAC.1